MSNNPFTSALGPALLAGVTDGDTLAIAEATRRIYVCQSTSKWVRMCAEVMDIPMPGTTTAPKATTKAKAKATPAPKKSRKGTGVGGAEHTALRAEARKWRIEQYHLGVKITDRDACLHFGTLPAKELAEVGMEGLAKAIKVYKAVKFAEAVATEQAA